LRSFIGILNQCDLIVGNDGGATNMAKALENPLYLLPWIEKKIWATLEDGIHHLSVHLNDYRPELLSQKTEKNLNRMLLPYIKNLNLRYLNLNLSIEHSIKLTTKEIQTE
jgi:heptosyltransferase-2